MKTILKPPHSYRPLRQVLAAEIRDSIIAGDLKPGQRIYEVEIAAAMNTSRSPVREALRELEAEGLVVSQPNKGASVVNFTRHDIIEIYAIRETLESLAIRWVSDQGLKCDLTGLLITASNMEQLLERPPSPRLRLEFIQLDVDFHTALVALARSHRLMAIVRPIFSHVHIINVVGSITCDSARVAQAVTEHRSVVQALGQGNAEVAQALLRDHLAGARERLLRTLDPSDCDR